MEPQGVKQKPKVLMVGNMSQEVGKMSLKAINVIWKLVNTIKGNIRGTLETSIYIPY